MTQDISEKDASKEAMQSQRSSTPELFTLQHKLQKLEEWLSGGANEKMQNMSVSEISTFENIINDIKDTISKAESRAQNAEARCVELTQANVQLNGELNSLKSQGSNRADLLEQKLMESDAQLEHARASLEAISEHQGMLRSSISDMEHMIQDLKEKYSKAETRAESAESKCTLLTDTNLELSEELSFLRGRVESLENSLRHANRQKLSTAKDIGIKTKTISDLVAKLALERERLHLQVCVLLLWKIHYFYYCVYVCSSGVMNLLYMFAAKKNYLCFGAYAFCVWLVSYRITSCSRNLDVPGKCRIN
jgi:chromosome segregation ATPase